MATSADRESGCVGDLDRGPGIYPLRVMMEHDDSQESYNKFSLRATATVPAPRIFGLGDMSVYANPDSGTTTKIFLAEVADENAGKELVIELFDVGDISGGSGGDQLKFYDGALHSSSAAGSQMMENPGPWDRASSTPLTSGSTGSCSPSPSPSLRTTPVRGSAVGIGLSTCTPGASTTPPPGLRMLSGIRFGSWSSRRSSLS